MFNSAPHTRPFSIWVMGKEGSHKSVRSWESLFREACFIPCWLSKFPGSVSMRSLPCPLPPAGLASWFLRWFWWVKRKSAAVFSNLSQKMPLFLYVWGILTKQWREVAIFENYGPSFTCTIEKLLAFLSEKVWWLMWQILAWDSQAPE